MSTHFMASLNVSCDVARHTSEISKLIINEVATNRDRDITTTYLEVLRLRDSERLPTPADHVTVLAGAQIRLVFERQRRHPLEAGERVVDVLQDGDTAALLARVSCCRDDIGQGKEQQSNKQRPCQMAHATARAFSVRHCFADASVTVGTLPDAG